MPTVPNRTPEDPPSDDALLERISSGDRASLEILFGKYRDAAWRVARRLLSSESDAMDAVQDGFIKALRNLDGFEKRSSFKTWLMRIVTNASLDLGRQKKRRETRRIRGDEGTEILDDVAGASEDPLAGLDHADLRADLDEALRQLPEAQRQTFVLHVDGEMSYREVADTLQISIGTVMSRLFYARQKLKVLLASRLSS